MKPETRNLTRVRVRVPGTTANLGPGFDCLGVALSCSNTIAVIRDPKAPTPDGMIGQTAGFYFHAAKVKPFAFTAKIAGNVPPSRGLGSSVTVRLGVLAGLNALAGNKLAPEALLDLCVELEGHPDNAVPAFWGGFAACTSKRYLTVPVAAKLKFIALIPSVECETKSARGILPETLSRADAVSNLQNVALITAAFCSQNYAALAGQFGDAIHQPARARILPILDEAIHAATKAGALGGFLSGSGSTVMAVTLDKPEAVAKALLAAAKKKKIPAEVRVLTADNRGLQIL
jgi:homoserine kinase